MTTIIVVFTVLVALFALACGVVVRHSAESERAERQHKREEARR